MQLVPVVSSYVDAIGFEDGVLEVHFKKNVVCQYPNVPESLFKDFLAAPSKGQFVHQRLRHLPYRRIQ